MFEPLSLYILASCQKFRKNKWTWRQARLVQQTTGALLSLHLDLYLSTGEAWWTRFPPFPTSQRPLLRTYFQHSSLCPTKRELGTPIFGRFIREFREQPQVARFFADRVSPHLQSRRRAEKGYKMSAAVPFLPMSPTLEGIPGEGWTGEPMAKKTFFPEKNTKWGCLRTPMVTIFITIDWDVYLVDKHPFATYLTQCSSMFFPRLEPDRWGGRLWPHGILSGHWHPLAAGGGEPGYGPGFHKEMLAGHIYIYIHIICGIYVYIYMLRDTAIFDTFLNFMVSETTRWWKTTLIFPTESRDEHPWAAAIWCDNIFSQMYR